MRCKMVIAGMVVIAISVLIVGIETTASSDSLFGKHGVSGEQSEKGRFVVLGETQSGTFGVLVTTVTSISDELLGKYETRDRAFTKRVFDDAIGYWHSRRIDDAVVEGDYIRYLFDRDTNELIEKDIHWRDDLPEHLPPVISKEEAESIAKSEAKGKIMNTSFAHTRLRYISPDSCWHPIKPMPKNPCWIIYFAEDKGYNTDVIIVDAVEGKILGHGVPFPSSGFSFSGPQDVPNCAGAWTDWYQNAEFWFNTMGYPTEAVLYPNEAKVKSHIQSYETAMFYEVAHGHWFTGFKSDCSGDRISPGEIRAWIDDYTKMPFTYIHSCGGMCYTGWPSLSDAFRKGSIEDTVTVGTCLDANCIEWKLEWQDTLFNYMNQGWTVKDAFDQACKVHQNCTECVRFAGDETFKVVPVVERGVKRPTTIGFSSSYEDPDYWYHIYGFEVMGIGATITYRVSKADKTLSVHEVLIGIERIEVDKPLSHSAPVTVNAGIVELEIEEWGLVPYDGYDYAHVVTVHFHCWPFDDTDWTFLDVYGSGFMKVFDWEFSDGISEAEKNAAMAAFERGEIPQRLYSFILNEQTGTNDIYEPDDDWHELTEDTIAIGETQTHSILPAIETDWLRFSLAEESAVTMGIRSHSYALRVELFDSGQNYKAGMTGVTQDVTTDVLAPGTYYVEITSAAGDDPVDQYEFFIYVPEPPADWTDAKHLADIEAGKNVHDTGEILPPADTDWYNITLLATFDVEIEIRGDENRDAEMWLYDSSGVPEAHIGYDDNSGEGLLPKITAQSLEPDTYYFKLESKDDESLQYSVVLKAATPGQLGDSYEDDDTLDKAGLITDGELQTHSFYPAGDTDWVIFNQDSAADVTIETSGTVDSDTEVWIYKKWECPTLAVDTDVGYFGYVPEKDFETVFEKAPPAFGANTSAGSTPEKDFETAIEDDSAARTSEANISVRYSSENPFTTVFEDTFSTNPWGRWDYYSGYPIGWSSSGGYVYLPYSKGGWTTWNTHMTHYFPSFPLEGCVEGKLEYRLKLSSSTEDDACLLVWYGRKSISQSNKYYIAARGDHGNCPGCSNPSIFDEIEYPSWTTKYTTFYGKSLNYDDSDFGDWIIYMWLGSNTDWDGSVDGKVKVTYVKLYCREDAPPYKPENPSPDNCSVNVGTSVNLEWEGRDPDAYDRGIGVYYDYVKYDVYLGTSPDSLELECENTISKSCYVYGLSSDTTYYWKVVAEDDFGKTNVSDIWSFYTGAELTQVVYDDNSGSGLYSKITKTLNPGTYYVKVKEKNNNVADSYNIKLLVGASPYASFTYTPPLGLTTGEITFNASDSYDPEGNISSYSWDFDASNGIQEDATGVKVTHQYITAGNYTVTLTVTGTSGTDTVSKNVTVKAPPVANFSYSGSDTEISFTDTSTDPDGGTIIGWYWDFEDGTTNSTQNPTHVFEQGEMDYVVTLVVMDNDSLVNRITKVAHAGSGPVNEPPNADFYYSITPFGNDTFQVQFNSTSTDSDGSIIGWLWEFGDGTLSLLENLIHNYTANGTYTVNLTVTDDDGAIDSTFQVINILATRAITTCEDLQNMNNNLSGNYYLATDIDCSGTVNWNSGAGFVPVGTFTGTFDGRGYKITDLYINRPSTDFVGLFVSAGSGSEIRDVGLENVDINGNEYVGGLVGQNRGTITDSYSTGSVTGTGLNFAGGLVGHNYGGTIENCYSTASVSGLYEVGGLVGSNEKPYSGVVARILNSYSTGSVTGTGRVGGLAGLNYRGEITNSYSHSSASGDSSDIGGLVGESYGATVTNSYSTGQVTGSGTYVAGLIGYKNAGTVTHSYWDIETSGQTTSAGGTGKTTAEMKQQATFVGWEFTNIWDIKEGVTYPYLQWQKVPVASFTYSPQYPTTEDTITFDASSSYDPDGTLVSYDWDFDDGNTSSGEIVTHQYTTVGTYTVTLTVTNNEGATNNLSKDIIVGVTLAEALDNTEINWTTGSDTNWFGQTETYIYDNASAQSAHIFNRQSTYIQTNVTGPGNLTFYWKVSSEDDYDFLRFFIDDIEQANISGEVDWHQMAFGIGPGSHTLKWSYTKDEYMKAGSDCGWLDKVMFPAGGPLWTRYSSRIDTETHCLGVGGFAIDSEDNVIIASNRDVIKYDSNGDILWEYDMCGCGVTVDKTDDSVVVGLCNSSIVKFSKTGSILWTKELQEVLYVSGAKSVNPDGNILAAGFGSIDGVWQSYFEIRDRNGNFIRSTTRPHNGWWPAAIFAEPGYIYLAYDLAQGVAIEKVTDDFSSTLWTTTLSNCSQYASGMAVDSENNLFVRGNTGVGGVGYNLYTAKIDGANGDLIWERIYDSGYHDFGGGLVINPSGDVLVVCTTGYEIGSKDKAGILIIKYSGYDGGELKHILYRKSPDDERFEVACGIVRDLEGCIYIGGKEYDISEGEGCGIETHRALTMKYGHI